MIKVFNANDRDFSSAGNIIIEPIKCIEYKKKSLNGWYIEVETSIKYKDYITKDKLCVVKTKSKLNPQAFRIGDNIQYSTKKIKFTADHVMFDAKDYVLLDVRPTNQNGLNALNYINQRTDNVSPFSIYSNVENIATAYFIRKNLLEAWATIEERWGGIFDADNWNISFLTSVGNDNGEVIAYGKNMEGFDIYEDWSSVCTKICPVGYDGLLLPEEYIESDIKYDKPYTRVIDFQTDLENEQQTEENLLIELREKANKYLEENKFPKISYTIISNINQKLEIGDTIKVLHPFVELFTEVLEYEYNLISKKVISLTFGNYSRDVKTKFDNIKQSISQFNTTLSKQESVIKAQTDLINTLNKNGYVYIDDNEILILDSIPKENAKNVWRFGLGGIGFSSNGYEGPFDIAMTMDGQINANFITTGTLNVSRIEGLANKISEYDTSIVNIELNLGTITQNVKETETKLENDYYKKTQTDSQIKQASDSIVSEVNKTISTAKQEAIDSANSSTDDKLRNYTTTEKMNSKITQTVENITSEVNKTIKEAKQEAIDTSNSETDNKLLDYTKTVDMNSAIEQKADSITSSVNQTINEAKQEAIDKSNSDTDNKLKNYSTTTQMNSAITQKANEISSTVSETYSTKEETSQAKEDAISSSNTNTDNKLKSYTKTVDMNSIIEQKADSITSKVNKKVDNDEWSTKIQQSAEDIRIAWNKISEYIQFINASLRINDYNDELLLKLDSNGLYLYDTDGSKIKMKLNRECQHFYEGGEHVGLIGTNSLQGYSNVRGLNFDLDTRGSYMTWASRNSSSESNYDMKLWYAKPNTGKLTEGLALGTDLDLNSRDIKIGKANITNWNNGSGVKCNDSFYFTDSNSNSYMQINTTDANISFYKNIDMHGYDIVNASNVASDGRLKKNIYSSKINAIDRIMQMKIREFTWKKDDKQENVGFIAQELEKIDPNYVQHNYKEDKEGNIIQDSYELRHSPIIATEAKAIQEQQEIIEKQQDTINKQQQFIKLLAEKLDIKKEYEEMFNSNLVRMMSIQEDEEVVFEGETKYESDKRLEPAPKYETKMKYLKNGEVEIYKEIGGI